MHEKRYFDQRRKETRVLMKKEKMNYGNIVDLEPVIYTEACLFIPKLFAWEKESVSAEVIVGDYRIQCNLGTKLLFKKGKGIEEKVIPFEKKAGVYTVDILEYFEKNNIAYEVGNGVYCDGTEYNQDDSSSEAIYNKDAIIQKILSPYWGLQMELYVVNKKLRPTVKGRKIKIVRFNYCLEEKQYEIEEWFMRVLNGAIRVDPYALDHVMRDNLERIDFTACSMFYQNDEAYKWEHYC